MENRLKITIVTVSYNSIDSIEKTILSVLNQTYSNIEYIVIDGKSKDGTVDIIKKYDNRLAYWVSESDDGIYDAMNKAIGQIASEWVLFMNTDDEFVDNDVIEKFALMADGRNGYAAFYGDVILKYKIGERLLRASDLRCMRYLMAFSHQSVFIRTTLMKQKKYSLKYKLAADYNFLLSLYLDKQMFYYLNYPISKVRIDAGASFANFVESKKEVLSIHLENGYSAFEAYYYYYKAVLRFKVSRIVKNVMPKGVVKKTLHIE